MSISKRLFGRMQDGTEVSIFKIINSKGSSMEVTNYGCRIVSIKMPDGTGKFDDVVLGFDTLDGYLNKNPHFGSVIGRYANRIENACFKINDITYNLAKNSGENHIHGGIVGFDNLLWNGEIIKKDDTECLILSYTSEDGEEGYPGKLDVKVTYKLTEDNAVEINYYAVSDKDTPVNLTNHSYFNLSGHGAGDISNNLVSINADSFTPSNKNLIPTGEIKSVEGTPMDLRKLTPIAPGLSSGYDQIEYAGGYDHNWVLNVSGKTPKKAAEVFDSGSKRVMEVYTTLPGIQFYTANFLKGPVTGKGGAIYNRRGALCLETQYFPNAINVKNFPSPLLKAGQEYNHTTIYKFSCR